MRKALPIILLLYVVALHSSIAGMEILSWLSVILTAAVLPKPSLLLLKDLFRRYRLVFGCLAGLTLWVLISLLTTTWERPFWFQFGFMRWTLLLPALAVLLVQIWSVEFERRLETLWVLAAIVVAVYASAQFFFGIDLIRPGSDAVKAQGGGIFKAVGFFSMSLTYAYVFGQSALAILRAGFRRAGPKWGALIAALFCLGIVASMSRGAWLAAIASVGLFLLFEKRKWLIPYIVVVGLFLFGASRLSDAIGSKLTDMAHGQVDHSSAIRLDLWRAYGHMFLDHPVFGVGISQGDQILPKYFAELNITQSFQSHAHNNYLQWLAGSGFLGFLFFVVLCFLFAKMAWDLRKVTPWGWALLMSLMFWQIGGLTECNFFDGEVNHFIVFCWALTWALHYKNFGPQSQSRSRA